MVKELLSKQEFEEFIKDGVTVVDFYATWCGPCKMLAPIIEELRNKGYKCGKMDIDKNVDLAMKYGIEVIPYVIIFKNGVPADKSIGLTSLQDLEEIIKKNI